MKTISGIEAHCAFDKEVDVVDLVPHPRNPKKHDDKQIALLDKFNAPDWKPRRWAWVDPLKDQQASILAVENHLKSKRQVISESGGDIEDVFRDIKKDEELAEDVGLEKPSESEPSVP